MKDKNESKNVVKIGAACIFSYLACYYLRNILGVATPKMLETGKFTKEFIGLLSSTYFIVYASGQLLNGILGDIFNPKKMVTIGLGISGLVNIIFPLCNVRWSQILCFGFMGFFLSMLRGPLMKIISENTIPKHARIICVFFNYSSFAGILIASILVVIFDWKWCFIVAGLASLLSAIIVFIVFSRLEKKEVLTYQRGKSQDFTEIFRVFKVEKFIFYMVIGSIVEIASVSIIFWIPTYLTEHLGFEATVASMIYSVFSFVRSFSSFIALFIFKIMSEKDVIMIRIVFSVAVVGFMSLVLITNPWANIMCLLFALMGIGCAGAVLWSIFIPGLGKTGMVSSANGILDFTGYVVAAIANIVFANLIDLISWNGVIVMWAALAGIGVITTFGMRKKLSVTDNFFGDYGGRQSN